MPTIGNILAAQVAAGQVARDTMQTLATRANRHAKGHHSHGRLVLCGDCSIPIDADCAFGLLQRDSNGLRMLFVCDQCRRERHPR